MPELGIPSHEVSMSMYRTRGRALLALVGLALLVALASAGCGRRLTPAVGSTPPVSAAPTMAVSATAGPSSEPLPSPIQPAPPSSAVPTPAAPASSAPSGAPVTQASPVPTPDLTGIQDLIDQLGRDLQADASASTSEGSPR